MVNRTASAHKSIPTTAENRERPGKYTGGQQGKGLDTPPKNSVTLDEWKAGQSDYSNPGGIYDNYEIQETCI